MPACNTETPDGLCAFPAGRCPRHDQLAAAPVDDAPSEPMKPAAALEMLLAAVNSGDASPLQAQRLVRAVQALSTMVNDHTEEELLYEAYLRGKIMNGIPPVNVEEWEWARRCYSDESLRDIASWPSLGGDETYPPWVLDLFDPESPRMAWRFKHALGCWNNETGHRRWVWTYVARGLEGDPFEGAQPSAKDGFAHPPGRFQAAVHDQIEWEHENSEKIRYRARPRRPKPQEEKQ